MALNITDSFSFGNRPVSSRNAMSPRLTLPRMSRGKSLPRTVMRSAVDQPSSERISFLAMSVRLDSRIVDDLGPAANLAPEEAGELLRAARHDLDAHLAEALLDFRGREHFHHFRIQALHDVARRAGDRKHAEPDAHVVARDAGLVHGRNVGREGRTRLGRDGDAFQLACA